MVYRISSGWTGRELTEHAEYRRRDAAKRYLVREFHFSETVAEEILIEADALNSACRYKVAFAGTRIARDETIFVRAIY